MKRAREMHHEAHICSIDPRSGWRSYGSYRKWYEAIESLQLLGDLIKHYFELIPANQPCKPYFDFEYMYDKDEDLKESTDDKKQRIRYGDINVQDFCPKVEKILLPILMKTVGVEETKWEHETGYKKCFVWANSSTTQKFSLHLIIHIVINGKMWLAPDSTMAGYINDQMLNESGEIGEELAKYTDSGVYTRNRLFRMIGSCKYQKPGAVLHFHNQVLSRDTFMMSTVTSFQYDAEPCVFHIPEHYKQGRNNMKHNRKRFTQIETELDCDAGYVVKRMEELVREKVHPTVYLTQSMDSEGIVRFNYANREERCYTSCIHEANMNFNCSVDKDSLEIYMHCYSSQCRKTPRYLLGPLYDEQKNPWDAITTNVHQNFISDGIMDENHVVGKTIKEWINKKFTTCVIKSGTGKSNYSH